MAQEQRAPAVVKNNVLSSHSRSATSRLLEVGRARATSGLAILLDELLAGLDVKQAQRLAATVARQRVSLVLVEHDVWMVLSMSSHVYVL